MPSNPIPARRLHGQLHVVSEEVSASLVSGHPSEQALHCTDSTAVPAQDGSFLQLWCAWWSDLCLLGGGRTAAKGLGRNDRGYRAQSGAHAAHSHHCQLHAERAVSPEGHSGFYHPSRHRVSTPTLDTKQAFFMHLLM